MYGNKSNRPAVEKHLHQHHCMPFPPAPQLSQQGGSDIRLLKPALQKQWDHDANAYCSTTPGQFRRHVTSVQMATCSKGQYPA